MSLNKPSVWLLLAGLMIVAVPDAHAQQVEIKGPRDASSQYSDATYGPIKSSDTLWAIASRYQRQYPQVSVYQVMQAIYQLNPAAFDDNNVNHMLDGSVLRMPALAYVARIDAAQAQQKIEADEKAWQAETAKSRGIEIRKSPEMIALEQNNQALNQKLAAIDSEQTRQFEMLRDQFGQSISNIEALLQQNRQVTQRLEKVDAELEALRGRLGKDGDVERQLSELASAQQNLLAQLEESKQAEQTRAEQANRGWDIPWWMLGVTLLSITLLGALFFMWRKMSGKPEAEKVTEQTSPEISDTPSAVVTDSVSDDPLPEDDMTLDGLDDDLIEDDLFGSDQIMESGLEDDNSAELDTIADDLIDEEPIIDDSASESEELTDPDVSDDLIDGGDLDDLFDSEEELLAPEAPAQTDEIVEQSTAGPDEPEDSETPEEDSVELQVLGDESEEQQDISITDEDLTDIEMMPVTDKSAVSDEKLDNLGEEIDKNSVEIDQLADQLINDLDSFDEMQSLLPDENDDSGTADEEAAIQDDDDVLSDDLLDELIAENQQDAPEADDSVPDDVGANAASEQQSSDLDTDEDYISGQDDELTDDLLDELIAENAPEENNEASEPVSMDDDPEQQADDELTDDLLDELIAEHGTENDELDELDASPQDDLSSVDDELDDVISDELLDELIAENQAENDSNSESADSDDETRDEGPQTADQLLDDIESQLTGDDDLDAALQELGLEEQPQEKPAPVPTDLDELLSESEQDDVLDALTAEAESEEDDGEDQQLIDELESSSFDDLLNDIPELGMGDEEEDTIEPGQTPDNSEEYQQANSLNSDDAGVSDTDAPTPGAPTPGAPDLGNPDLDLEALLQDADDDQDYVDVASLLEESDDGDQDLPELNIDLEDLGFESVIAEEESAEPIGSDETDGQLDLAIAYMEMGDNELAKEILQQLSEQADGQTADEAKRLLDKLG